MIKGGESLAGQLGLDPELDDLYRAAEFMAGCSSDETFSRSAAIRHDGDVEAQALAAHGLEVTDQNRKTLRGIAQAMSKKLSKAEIEPEGKIKISEVVAVTPDSEPFAEIVRRAAKSGDAESVKLGGKHSKGTAAVKDPETSRMLLLKPGSGGQNPAAGEDQSAASQSKREAAFYAAAAVFGLQNFLPEAHLLIVDGIETAALHLLPIPYRNLNQLKKQDPHGPRRLLSIYLGDGDIHKWATMDYVLGNVDRNGGNVMTAGSEVKLIDHGSTFAGDDFDPKDDVSTFVPVYLRAMVDIDWVASTPGQRYASLPRIHDKVANALASWLVAIPGEQITTAAGRFGVDTAPCLARLEKLKTDVTMMAPDLAINAAWTL
jgi:hypothetical protein